MKQSLLSILLLVGLAAAAVAQEAKPAWEMDTYQFLFYVKGANWSPTVTEETKRIQTEHLAYIGKMAETGKLVGAGPLADNVNKRGILIFHGVSLAEAKTMAEADPAVKAGRLQIEGHTWWGPKGIGAKFAEEHKQNPTAKIEMVTYQLGLLVRGAKPRTESADALNRMQQQHVAHIFSMARTGKVVAAGPFGDDGDVRGLLVFTVSAEEAKAMVEPDPFIKAGYLVLELYPLMVARGVMP